MDPIFPSIATPSTNASVLEKARGTVVDATSLTLIAVAPLIGISVFLSHLQAAETNQEPLSLSQLVWFAGALAALLLRSQPNRRVRAAVVATTMGALLVHATFTLGPTLGLGMGWIILTNYTEFIIGRRRGLAVIFAYIAATLTQLVLLRGGLIGYPDGFSEHVSFLTLARMFVVGILGLGSTYYMTSKTIALIEKSHADTVREHTARIDATLARQEAEKRMQANQHFEALGKLAGGVAHDVNNVLTTILCSTELLRTKPLDREQEELADDISSAARNAAQTTRHLLSLNRRTYSDPRPVLPQPIITSVCRLASRLMPENIHISCEGHCDKVIEVDPADLQQALLNLLLNARDAMPKGGAVCLTVNEFSVEDLTTSDWVRICVSDTGHGISPENARHLFQPFFSTKAPGKGTGLGLTLVKQFVEDSDGELNWDSIPGRGTTFQLDFPALPAQSATPEGSERSPDSVASGARILLVEDMAPLRKLIKRSLLRGGFRVTAASGIEEALHVLDRDDQFDLLCTDGIVSNTPTSVLIDRFCASAKPDRPVILISGHVDDALITGGVGQSKVDRFLRKPFSGQELVDAARELLESSPGTDRSPPQAPLK